jgi:hypothetical protein
MTVEVARDMIDYLTSRYGSDAEVTRWVDGINIYVVGSVNPDGGAYVFTADNWWRKNRHPSCAVDNNRNYRFLWNSCNGSSGACSSETYRGGGPNSEPETQGMVELTASLRPFFALTYHSYGEYIMYSYGCSDPDEKAAMDAVAQGLNSILENDNGQTGRYATGPIGSTIYLVDGGSSDTQYGLYGAYAYTIEVNCCDFQPDYGSWRDITVERQRTAWQYFLDKTLDSPQIQGKVTDAATGAPLGAEVSVDEVTFTHGEAPRVADSKGLYHWLAQSGLTYHVNFSFPGYCTETRTVTVGSGPSVVNVAMGYPAAPSGLGAVGSGDNRIAVTWSAVPGATEYRIYRSLSSGGPYDLVGTVAAPQTSFTDTPVSGAVRYYYVVRSYEACESPDSIEVSAVTTGPCTAAPAFAGLTSVGDTGSATCTLDLSWSAAAARCGGLVTYEVYRSTAATFVPSPANRIASGVVGTSFSDHGGLASAIPYFYIVRAVDSTNGAPDGNLVTLGATPTGPPAPGTWLDDGGDVGNAKLAGEAPWSALPTGGKTGPKVYATGAYSDGLCSSLTTPAITLETGSVLSFTSKWDIETNFDAGVVEVATGPTFANWTKLTTLNYPNPLNNTGNACGFPVSGPNTVFSRTRTEPIYPATPYTGSLAAFDGQEIKLRFRLGTDDATTGAGWWIDDIAITNAWAPGACTTGQAPGPKEVSPLGTPMTCGRAPSGTAIEVSYLPACGALDNAIYWGVSPIVGSVVWSQSACALGNTGHASFNPGNPLPGEFFYFVVVGQNGSAEGSYGQSFNGSTYTERPEAVGIGSCDKPRVLGGVCP